MKKVEFGLHQEVTGRIFNDPLIDKVTRQASQKLLTATKEKVEQMGMSFDEFCSKFKATISSDYEVYKEKEEVKVKVNFKVSFEPR